MEEKGRVFNESSIDSEVYIFDRRAENNVLDIGCSAALAIHKSLIGIAELSALESAKNTLQSQFRRAIAIQTYYVIYHLFACCMFLDQEYEIRFKKRGFYYGASLDALEVEASTPSEWKSLGKIEQDLATRIKHIDIKNYCSGNRYNSIEGLRTRITRRANSVPEYLKCLYDNFVDNDCRLVLFEKADYIRDRAIYRPSHVVSGINSNPIQTSEDVRKEIDSLPSSRQLYVVIKEIHQKICSIETVYTYPYCFAFSKEGVDCKTKYAQDLGYSWDILKQVGGEEGNEMVPTFICQMMELFEARETVQFYNEYWKSLIKMANDEIFRRGFM